MSEYKECPYCAEQILSRAVKCKHCQSLIEKATADKPVDTPAPHGKKEKAPSAGKEAAAPQPQDKQAAAPPPPLPPSPPVTQQTSPAPTVKKKGSPLKTVTVVIGSIIGVAALGVIALFIYYLINPAELEVISVTTAPAVTTEGRPVNATDTFYTDAGDIFVALEIKNVPAETNLTSSWYYEDADYLIDSVTIEPHQGHSTPYFSLFADDWPEGSYLVELSIDNEIIATARFRVVVETGTISFDWEGEPGEYQGQLRSGIPHGQGTWHGTYDGEYTGDWADGKFHGYGVFDSSFAYYEGEWFEGVPHGYGTLTVYGDFSYTGGFKDGNPHGEGILTKTDGTVTEGYWIDGELVE